MNNEIISKTPLTQQPAKKELIKQILALMTIDLNEDCTHNKSRMPKMRLKRVSIDVLQKALQYAMTYYNTNQTKISFTRLGSFIDIQNRKKILDSMF